MWIAEVAHSLPLHRTFDYEIPQPLLGSARPGVRVRAPFGRQHLVGVLLSVRQGESQRPLKFIESIVDEESLLPPEMMGLADWISKRYLAPPGECLKALLPAFVKVAKNFPETSSPLMGKGRGDSVQAFPPSLPSPTHDFRNQQMRSGEGVVPDAAFTLTSGQDAAVEGLLAQLRENRFSATLLYGVPASGKTEVYLRVMRDAIQNGGQALYLLPEISLTRPFFEELSRRAGFSVAQWHSRLGLKERRTVWHGLRNGKIGAVVGARSACLLSFKNLRMIVMDEEQDESFKQEGQSPLYHARDMILERARRTGALAVLGSATPSLETVSLVAGGKLRLLRLDERVNRPEEPPRVEIIDKPPKRGSCISENLLERIKERLARREQVILLVNRRGFSNFAICRKCGWVARCRACAIAFVHHRLEPGKFELQCHQCGRKSPVPEHCPNCKAPGLSFSGIGTQKVVEEIQAKLPEARVLRMDRDTVSRERGSQDQRLYDRFKSGHADILVGTKLVAKGFHFPDVTLVGVIDADTMLDMPDFRSAEKTVQLLLQAAGRSGRAEKKGEVLIQTSHPTHYALQAVARGDYLRYAQQEMKFRKELGYPPAASLVRLVFSGLREENVRGSAEKIADMLAKRFEAPAAEILGPSPAVHAKLRGRFRYHILVKLRDLSVFNLALLEEMRSHLASAVRMQVNVDPYDLF